MRSSVLSTFDSCLHDFTFLNKQMKNSNCLVDKLIMIKPEANFIKECTFILGDIRNDSIVIRKSEIIKTIKAMKRET